MKTEIVKDGMGRDLALIIRQAREMESGVHFHTGATQPMQVGTIKHEAGTIVQAHHHLDPTYRYIDSTQEVLVLLEGRLRVDFYASDWEVQSEVLESGDVVVLMSGGHGFTALSDVRALEVRQGPYFGREVEKAPIMRKREGNATS